MTEAITFTLSRLSGELLAPEGGAPAIEMLGYLELQLDDAPILILTGVNEGCIPQARNHDAYLPDSARRLLGLADNRRRYVRDLVMLTAMMHSRESLTVISGRRGLDHQPLTPSRLLLSGAPPQLAKRIQHFYPRGHDIDAGRSVNTTLLAHGSISQFQVPPPCPPDPPLMELPVTAFRSYLDCPYRFYLRIICGLKPLTDDAVELESREFGNLAHEVLRSFGDSEWAESTDHGAVSRFLSEELERQAQFRFGMEPRAAVRIQVEQLRERLIRFAHWQVLQVVDGWRIEHRLVERELSAPLVVDGQPFVIRGRIDRIDRHRNGTWRILDYKTADQALSPEKAHRAGPSDDKRWIDLQLPLYQVLVRYLGLEGPIELGFVHLPKQLEQVALTAAEWTPQEIDQAVEQARQVVRNIRQGRFWPPNEHHRYLDDLSVICMATCVDREAGLQAGDEQPGW